jgi:hypothetical protein
MKFTMKKILTKSKKFERYYALKILVVGQIKIYVWEWLIQNKQFEK